MARDVLAVVAGSGTLYWDEVDGGEAVFPANPTTAPAAGWEDIGYSEEGWAFEADKTFENIVVDEEVDPLNTLKTAQELRLVGVMAQSGQEQLKLAMGGGTIAVGTPAGYDTYTPPASTAFTEFQLLLRVPSPGGGALLRDIHVPRAIATGSFSMRYKKAPDIALTAVEFRIVKPAAGDIFTVIDDLTT